MTHLFIFSDSTHGGSTVCKQLEEYLIGKLEKDHSGVKLKVLRIVRYCCENDCSLEFRRLMQRKADAFRRAQSFRGVEDPLRGDSPNKNVRDEAQLALKALFSDDKPPSTSVRIESVGSSESLGSRPSVIRTSPSSSMTSMGNPNFDNYAPPPTQTSFSDIIRSDNVARDLMAAVSTGMQSVVQSIATYTSSSQQPSNFRSIGPAAPWVPPRVAEIPVPIEAPFRATPSPVSSTHTVIAQVCMSNSGRVGVSASALAAFAAQSSESDFGLAVAAKLGDQSVSWLQKLKLITALDSVEPGTWVDDVVVPLLSLVSSPQCGSKARKLLSKWDQVEPEVKGDLLEFAANEDNDLLVDLLDIADATVSTNVVNASESKIVNEVEFFSLI